MTLPMKNVTETAAAVIESLRPFSVKAEKCDDMTCLYEAAERLCKEACREAYDLEESLDDEDAMMAELHEAARKCGDPLIDVAVGYVKL